MDELERIWRVKADDELRTAAASPGDYEPRARAVILAEYERRNLASVTVEYVKPEDCESGLAGRWQRAAARFVDILIALVPMAVVPLPPIKDGEFVVTSPFAVAILFCWSYLLLADALLKQSIGKRLLRIAVVDSATRERCGWWRLLLRSIPTGVPVLNIVDGLFIFGPKRKRLGDVLARTVVVQVAKSR